MKDIYLKPLTCNEWIESRHYIHSGEYRKFDPQWPVRTSAEEAEFWNDEVERGRQIVMGIYLKPGDDLIGYINAFDFNEKKGVCESGITIFPPVNFGKGYGSRAYPLFLRYLAKHKGIRHVIVLTHPENVRAQRLFLKIGFKDCGTFKDDGISWMKMYYDLKSLTEKKPVMGDIIAVKAHHLE